MYKKINLKRDNRLCLNLNIDELKKLRLNAESGGTTMNHLIRSKLFKQKKVKFL